MRTAAPHDVDNAWKCADDADQLARQRVDEILRSARLAGELDGERRLVSGDRVIDLAYTDVHSARGFDSARLSHA